MVLKGVIDSPDIPLNVSRSYLQTDRTVRQLAGHISKKVTDSLSSLYKTDRERFLKAWQDVSLIVKLGILEDDKFYERAKEFLDLERYIKQNGQPFKNISSETVKRPRKSVLHHRRKACGDILQIYRDKGIEILSCKQPPRPLLDTVFGRENHSGHFQRIDAEVHENIVDKSREKICFRAEGRTEAAKIAEFMRPN